MKTKTFSAGSLISKFVVSLLAITLLLQSSVVAVVATEKSADYKIFSDVEFGNENYGAIEYLKSEGVVQGYADGSFKVDSSINRAEFLKIVMEAAQLAKGGEDCYRDVKNDWYAAYVCGATKLDLVKGYDDGYFRPERNINFVEASKIIVNAMNVTAETEGEPTPDGGQVWYEKYVTALEDEKAIPKTISGFDHKVTRGEMAEMVWRIKEKPDYVQTLSYRGVERRAEASESGGAMLSFESCVDLGDYIKENTETSYPNYEVMGLPMATKMVEEGDDVETDAVPSQDLGSGVNYSETNVQVAGVDEADIVKTDGEYIYLLKNASVRVVKAYPADQMLELDHISFADGNFYPQDMYVAGDRLVVIGMDYSPIRILYEDYEEDYVVPDGDSDPYYGNDVTRVFVFDISNKEDVKLFRELGFEGDYVSSRKVDEVVYLISNKNQYYYADDTYPLRDETLIPSYSDSFEKEIQPVAPCDDVMYFPGVESNQYMVIAAIPVYDADANIEKEVVMGAGDNIYASRENLYVAQSKYGWYWANDDKEETVINKFSLSSDDIKYIGKGSVPGTILNQFSMDEHENYFRIATTLGDVWDTETPSQNNLYVLDANLKQTGQIEGIAPGEKIYSVRFMGDRAYIVTFKKVDPFFVLDVADPSSPKILGKLKIPGYSDYLHPLDENHIIGFGKEAEDASVEEVEARDLDFAWYQGMKIAMFDVTDVTNPVELHKEVIGDRGTDSPLLTNHKALMFDKARGIMAFPVTLAQIPEAEKDSAEATRYGDYVFQGAYVYKVSVEGGFDLLGRITHYPDDEVKKMSGYYWYGEKDIERILYIGDYLYTVSRAIVMGSNISDLSMVNKVELKKVDGEEDDSVYIY